MEKKQNATEPVNAVPKQYKKYIGEMLEHIHSVKSLKFIFQCVEFCYKHDEPS